MKRGQVFVRAQSPSGKWHAADVLDLDELSFRAFVLDRLINANHVVSMNPGMIEGDHITFKTVNEPSEETKG